MIDRGKKNVLGVAVDAVDYEASVDKIMTAANEKRSLTTAALAVHGVMTGVLDTRHRYRLNNLDLVVPDGQPVRWALNLLHKSHLPDRVYGPNLMLHVCEAAARSQIPIFLFGSRKKVIDRLIRNLTSMFPALEIAGSKPSLFRPASLSENDEILDGIASSGAAITFIGLGCPRQEVWAFENGPRLSMPVLAVGAAYDFHAGLLRQAPMFLQRAGLEWAFRLAIEPRRLWRRYLLLNPHFVYLVALQYFRLRSFHLKDVTPPSEDLRFS